MSGTEKPRPSECPLINSSFVDIDAIKLDFVSRYIENMNKFCLENLTIPVDVVVQLPVCMSKHRTQTFSTLMLDALLIGINMDRVA